MEKSEVDLPGYPYIIVSKLRTDIIKKAIQAFSDEKDQAQWLKLYHIGIALDIKDFNAALDRQKKRTMDE